MGDNHINYENSFENMLFITTITDSDTIDAMASGVENAIVFVLCYSEKYFQSPNCRSGVVNNCIHISRFTCTEAKYARTLNKTILPVRTEKYVPSSWLGIIVGANLYHDCLTVDDAEKCANEVSEELRNRGKVTSSSKGQYCLKE